MKRYLLDTHVVVWWLTHPHKLKARARDVLAHEDCAVSVVSLWEMLSKQAAGKLRLPAKPLSEALPALGFGLLSLTPEHVEHGAALVGVPDPFDRMIAGVARHERMVLVTRDGLLLEQVATLLADMILEA